MSIFDGFKFWLGKALFDVSVFLGIVLLLVALYFGLVAYVRVVTWWRKRRTPTVNPQS